MVGTMSISHIKASQLIHADLDGSLSPNERAALDEHLATCSQCQAEFASMANLDEHLRASLRRHWARKNVTAAELSKITARVGLGPARPSPLPPPDGRTGMRPSTAPMQPSSGFTERRT